MADKLYDNISRMPNLRGEVVISDSDKSTIGSRVSLAKQHGYPYIVVVGKKVSISFINFSITFLVPLHQKIWGILLYQCPFVCLSVQNFTEKLNISLLLLN